MDTIEVKSIDAVNMIKSEQDTFIRRSAHNNLITSNITFFYPTSPWFTSS